MRTFVDDYLVNHKFIKALHDRFRDEGIVIPLPIRTVYLKSDGEQEVAGRGTLRESADHLN